MWFMTTKEWNKLVIAYFKQLYQESDKNPPHFKTDDLGLTKLSVMMDLFYNLSFLRCKPYMTNAHLKYR